MSELEKQLGEGQQAASKEDSDAQPSFKEFMKIRLEQSQAEAKRHFENYVKVRDQLNQLMEKQVLASDSSMATPDSQARSQITPKGGVKGSKLKQDILQRAFAANI